MCYTGTQLISGYILKRIIGNSQMVASLVDIGKSQFPYGGITSRFKEIPSSGSIIPLLALLQTIFCIIIFCRVIRIRGYRRTL